MVYNDRNNSRQKNRKEEIITSHVVKEEKLEELIRDEAKKFAEGIINMRKKQEDAYTQIRRFYDELVRIQTKSKDDNDSFDKYLPAVYIIASQAAYAQARGKLSASFEKFIVENIRAITIKDDLDKFILYFEAILGYLKYFEKKNKNRKYQ